MQKALVAYFSASGITTGVAKKLAHAVQADLYEIKPLSPYTSADLNWMDKASRSSLEMKDPAIRPAVVPNLPDIQKYDIIFVGFPVWWYREPSIIDTFLESCDFNGRLVIPFATSHGSPIGDAGKNMQKLIPHATVHAGQCFPKTVTEEELAAWAKNFL